MATEIRRERGVGIEAGGKRARATWTRAFAVCLLVLVLPTLGAGPAAAEDYEPPVVTPSVPGPDPERGGSVPGGIIVRWKHNGDGVWDFSVERENPPGRWDNVQKSQSQHYQLYDGGLQPDREYRYRVCAYFTTEDGDTACSDWVAGRTSPPEAPSSQPPPPQPRIIGHDGGETWIGVNWEAGYDYDSYFVFAIGPFGTAKGLGEVRAFKHEHDGMRGYRRVNGLLPGRTYTFVVQGCTSTFLGLGADHCRETSKSPIYDAKTSPMALHSGPDTCAPPFVWREAFPGDHVCVDEGRRRQVAKDNAEAQGRRAYTCIPPNCTFTAPDTCKVPYVWREARPSDHVCARVEERSRVAAENALANQRRAVPR